MRSLKSGRKFNGHVYKYYASFRTKTEAQAEAKEIRSIGGGARIVMLPPDAVKRGFTGRYAVYWTKG